MTTEDAQMVLANLGPVERVVSIVAKMRADLTAIGGFDNRFIGQPAVNVREYIEDLEAALGTGPNV